MQKTRIEWTDYTANPIKGVCKTACPYCYARTLYTRFGWNKRVRLDLSAMDNPPIGKKVFVCSTHEMFGDWIPDNWIHKILDEIWVNQRTTFQILTKNPKRAKDFCFPRNVWLGVTVESQREVLRIKYLQQSEAVVKFISFEPLRSDIAWVEWQEDALQWVIIGAETGNRKGKIIPKREWVENIVDYCRRGRIPIFLKNNLKPVWGSRLIQEFPKLEDSNSQL